jgi:hypothetical protein
MPEFNPVTGPRLQGLKWRARAGIVWPALFDLADRGLSLSDESDFLRFGGHFWD